MKTALAILTALLRRGLRRAPADADLAFAMGQYKEGRAAGDFEHGIEQAVRALLVSPELLYRFEFPERQGALMKFLKSMNPSWNISLFHYRNHGADYGRVLVGLQVPASDAKAFKAFLGELAYPYVEETDNPAYRLFLA